MDDALVGLADVIEALRKELVDAAGRSDGPMRFALEPIEMTVHVVVTKDVKGNIGWKVLEAGGSYQSERTQTLTLRLSPLWETKEGILTRDFAIASESLSGDVLGPHH